MTLVSRGNRSLQIQQACLKPAVFKSSPNYDQRPQGEISLIVIHNISLPAGHFGGSYVEKLFCNQLSVVHPDFKDLQGLKVSSHLFIRRTGEIIQWVPFDQRAWHAGRSSYQGRMDCNDFSIGIELEGTDESAYQNDQYVQLADICKLLAAEYDIGTDAIVGHSDIAPGRKSDPGPAFNWFYFRELMKKA